MPIHATVAPMLLVPAPVALPGRRTWWARLLGVAGGRACRARQSGAEPLRWVHERFRGGRRRTCRP